MNKIRSFRALIFFGFLCFEIFSLTKLNCYSQDSPKQTIKVSKIENNQVVLDVYHLNNSQSIDISDLILSEKYVKGTNLPSELKTTWQNVPDVKLILLEKGYAQLKNFEGAEEKYKTAQTKAQKNNYGIWYQPTPSPSPTQTVLSNSSSSQPLVEVSPLSQNSTPVSNSTSPTKPDTPEEPWLIVLIITTIWNWIYVNWFYVLNLGIVGLLVTVFYPIAQAKWRERKIKLIIWGESFSGKTALFLRIADEDLSKEEILKLSPTTAVERYPMTRPVSHGKLDIYLRLMDIPGTDYSTIWDEFLRNRFTRTPALLVVLAPTINKTKGQGTVVDKEYIKLQLGLLKGALVGGVGAKKTRKPKVVIFFLNKFDLFSDHHPKTREGEPYKKEFQKIFEEHINECLKSLDSAKIPRAFVIGSALENWNCDQIVKNIKNNIYGK